MHRNYRIEFRLAFANTIRATLIAALVVGFVPSAVFAQIPKDKFIQDFERMRVNVLAILVPIMPN